MRINRPHRPILACVLGFLAVSCGGGPMSVPSNPSDTTVTHMSSSTDGQAHASDLSHVGFSSTNYSVHAAQGGLLITVQRFSGSNPLSVHFSTSPGTARNGGLDYTDVSGTLIFQAAVQAQTFWVPITKHISIGPKTIHLSIGGPSSPTQCSPSQATLTLLDDTIAPHF